MWQSQGGKFPVADRSPRFSIILKNTTYGSFITKHTQYIVDNAFYNS